MTASMAGKEHLYNQPWKAKANASNIELPWLELKINTSDKH